MSSWFRDYVYIPLGGSRVGVARYASNVVLVFALSGLWHGASWTFVLWGLYHGILVMTEAYFFSTPTRSMTRRLAVFVAVSLGWVLFRAPSVSAAFGIVQRMLSIRVNKDAVRLSVLPFTNDHTALAAALVTTCLIVTMFVAERRRAEKQSAFPSAIGTAGVFVCVILFGILRPTSFIYFQF